MGLRRFVGILLAVGSATAPAGGEIVRAWETTVLDSSLRGFETARARLLADDSLMVVGTEAAGLAAIRYDAAGVVLSRVVLPLAGSIRVDIDPFGVVAAVGSWRGTSAVFLLDGLTGNSLWPVPFVLDSRVGAQDLLARVAFAANGDVIALAAYGPSHDWDLAAFRLGRGDGVPLWPNPPILPAGTSAFDAIGRMALTPNGDLALATESGNVLRVQVYDGTSGAPRWFSPAEFVAAAGSIVRIGGDPACDRAGNVFVTARDFDGGAQRSRWVTLSYDASSGGERWRATRSADGVGPRCVVVDGEGRALVAGEETGRITAIRYSSSGLEGPLVSWPAPPESSSWTLAQAFSEEGDDVILVAAEGWATRRTAPAGQELWSRRLLLSPGPSQPEPTPSQFIRSRTNSFTITAHEGSTEKIDSVTGADIWPSLVGMSGSFPAPAFLGFLGSRPNGDAVVGSAIGPSTAWRLEGGTGAAAPGWPGVVTDCYPRQMALDPQGNVAFLCGLGSTQPTQLVVSKLDGTSGTPAWSAPAAVGDTPYASDPPLLVADPGGNLLVSHTSADGSFRAVKVRGDGTVAWSSEVLPRGPHSYVPRALAADSSGNVAVAVRDLFSDAFVTKVRGADGAALWPTPFPIAGGGNQGHFLGMGTDGAGAVFVAAWIEVVSGVSTSFVLRLWKLDGADGTPIWNRELSSPILEDSLAVGESGDVTFVAARPNHSPPSLSWDYAVTRLSGTDGSPVWAQPFVIPGGSMGTMTANLLLRANGNAVVHVGGMPPTTWEVDGASGAAVWGPLPDESFERYARMDLTPDGLTLLGWTGSRVGKVVHYTTSLAIDVGLSDIPPARCGVPYSYALTARNAVAPVAWSAPSGGLPPGISLDPSGVLSGSSSSTGRHSFRLRVLDGAGAVAERDVTLDVVCDGRVTIVGASAAPCGAGATLSVSGTWSSYHWLPGGESTPTLTVTPRTRSTYGVEVTDVNGCTFRGTAEVDVLTSVAPVIAAPPGATAGERRLVASVPAAPGRTYLWSIAGGAIGSGQGTSAITFAAGRPGTLWLGVGQTEPAGCPVAPAYAAVLVSPAPSTLQVLPPCRLLDTRRPQDGPRLQANETRLLSVPGRCGIPVTANGVVLNVTAVQPDETGALVVLPGDAPAAAANTVSFRWGQTRAAMSIVPLAVDGSGTIAIRNDSSGSVDLVLDVSGWFE